MNEFDRKKVDKLMSVLRKYSNDHVAVTQLGIRIMEDESFAQELLELLK